MSGVAGRTGVDDDVVIVHAGDPTMTALTVALGAMHYRVTSAETRAVLRTARRHAAAGPAAMVVALDGTENIAEVRGLFAIGPHVRFVLVMPGMPASASLNRIVTAHGSTIVARDDPLVVIVATLVALLAPSPQAASDL